MAVELDPYEEKFYSQGGEDGVINEIFNRIGTTNKFCVDLGAYNAVESSNVAHLIDQGWSGILIDGSAKSANPKVEVFNHFVTAENVNDLLRAHNCPQKFDFLSIDLDGNDFWVWQALEFEPRALIIEYNGHVPANVSSVIDYEPDFQFKWTDYFGASLLAFKELGAKKGYTLVYADRAGVNCLFVHNDFKNFFDEHTVEELWRPLFYGPYTPDEREMRRPFSEDEGFFS